MKLEELRERFKTFRRGTPIRHAINREPPDRDRAVPKSALHLLDPWAVDATYCGRSLKMELMESVNFRFTDSVEHFSAVRGACEGCLTGVLGGPHHTSRKT